MMVLPRRSIGCAAHKRGASSLHRIVRRAAVWLVVATGPAIAAGASAQSYTVRNQGAWTLAPSSDAPGCFMTRTYAGDGGTTLLFGLDADGRNHLSVLNDNWSIEPQDRLTLDFRLSNRRYARQSAIGMTSDGKRGFVTRFPSRFATDLATSRFLYIDRGDVPVARLTLDGSAPAIAELKRCIAAVAVQPSPKAAAGRGDVSVPKDPFARGKGKPSHTRR